MGAKDPYLQWQGNGAGVRARGPAGSLFRGQAERSDSSTIGNAMASSRSPAKAAPKGTLSARAKEERRRRRTVLARAELVFGSGETARRWLKRPNRALEGEVPTRLLRSKVGTEEVLEILARIRYGVYS